MSLWPRPIGSGGASRACFLLGSAERTPLLSRTPEEQGLKGCVITLGRVVQGGLVPYRAYQTYSNQGAYLLLPPLPPEPSCMKTISTAP